MPVNGKSILVQLKIIWTCQKRFGSIQNHFGNKGYFQYFSENIMNSHSILDIMTTTKSISNMDQMDQKHLDMALCSKSRGVARGGAEGARPLPEFGRSVNPIQTRGGRLCPSHYCQPPRIQKAIYISEKQHDEISQIKVDICIQCSIETKLYIPSTIKTQMIFYFGCCLAN